MLMVCWACVIFDQYVATVYLRNDRK